MLTIPQIHMNGTSADRLRDALETAYGKLGDAYDALRETAPNGRDYYHVPGALDKAIQEHMARLKRVDSIRNELEELIGGIDQQAR